MTMRRAFAAITSLALATLAFAGVALASPGTTPDLEVSLSPDDLTTGGALLIQAYVHYGTKPYQGAQVQFEINGPNVSKLVLNAKPAEAGKYRAQFTPQSGGDFTITTMIDGRVASPKPYHFQVSGAAVPEWTKLAAGAIAGAAALALGAILFRRRNLAGRTATVTG